MADQTCVSGNGYPVRWHGRRAVVTLPEQIDVSSSGLIREQLLAIINRGATALIADMTATISCDHSGADAVARACRRAAASGTEVRLVVTAQIVRRVLAISGLDRLVSIYPSLEAAMAAKVPAARTPPTQVGSPAEPGPAADRPAARRRMRRRATAALPRPRRPARPPARTRRSRPR